MFIKTATITLLTKFDTLLIMSKNVSISSGKSRFYVICNAIYCLYRFGVIFTEYQAFDFIRRTNKNRATFVTVLWLLKILKKYNPKEFRDVFHDKRRFDEEFAEFIKRDSMSITSYDKHVDKFLDEHKRIVLKKSKGCSGKQIYVSKVTDTKEYITELIKKEHFDLIEEVITNCEEIKRLNPTSLNTIRVVTFRNGNYFKVLCACLRIGAVGSFVDNVSCGGTAARINLDSHKLDSIFMANSYRECENSQKGRNEIGMSIPYWNEVIEMVERASLKVPQIHYVGWDIAITDKGPIMVEGNESFHTVVMQFYASIDEPGLKGVFEETLNQISAKQ